MIGAFRLGCGPSQISRGLSDEDAGEPPGIKEHVGRAGLRVRLTADQVTGHRGQSPSAQGSLNGHFFPDSGVPEAFIRAG